MQALQGMDVDTMVIVLPSGLIAIYLIITIQKYLCNKENKYLGLIFPVVCFIASTVLAIRPLIVGDPNQPGLGVFCLRMWLTFNISTIVFSFQYFRQRRVLKQQKAYAAALEAEAAAMAQAAPETAEASEVSEEAAPSAE